jgi:hypothetical protein
MDIIDVLGGNGYFEEELIEFSCYILIIIL